MFRKNRVLPLTIIMLIVLAIPMAAMASPNKWIARISYRNEVPPAAGTSANGTAQIRGTAGSPIYQVAVQQLSGSVTAVHIHGPADATQNAPVLITLCSNNCPALDGNGMFFLEGSITPAMLIAAGLTGQQFINYLNTEMLYVNVHTALNPAGEARGQFVPFNP